MAGKSSGPVSITITPSSIFWAVAIVLGVWLLFFLKNLVLIVLTAVVISSSIEPAVLWLRRRHIHRIAATALVYVTIFGFLFGVAYFLFPPLINDTSNFVSTLPQYLDTLQVDTKIPTQFIQTTQEVAKADSVSLIDTLREFQNIFTSTGEGAFRTVAGVFGGVFSFLLILVLSFYFAVQETGIDDFLRIVTPVKHQKYAISLWRRSQVKIGLWMQGQLLLSLIIAVMTYLWLTVLGVPYALLIAIFAAIAELVPVFGSIVAGASATAVAFTAGGVSLALLAAGGYLVINQIQANLIYPLVVKRVVGL